MSQSRLLLDFHGTVDNATLRALLKEMDVKMGELGETRIFMKKINSILIECLQNLMHHATATPLGNITYPSVVVEKQDDLTYIIKAANLVNAYQQDRLSAYLDRINNFDADQLRDFYQQTLSNGQFNPEGGAGLGMLNMARKSVNNKLQYTFSGPDDQGRRVFELSIAVRP